MELDQKLFWDILTPNFIGIQIHRLEDDEEDYFLHRSSIVFFTSAEENLLSGKDVDGVVVLTNVVSEDLEKCLLDTLSSVNNIFGSILKIALVLNQSGEVIDRLDVSKIAKSHYGEDSVEIINNGMTNTTLH